MRAGSDPFAVLFQWCRQLACRPLAAYAAAVTGACLALALDAALGLAASAPVPHLVLGPVVLVAALVVLFAVHGLQAWQRREARR